MWQVNYLQIISMIKKTKMPSDRWARRRNVHKENTISLASKPDDYGV